MNVPENPLIARDGIRQGSVGSRTAFRLLATSIVVLGALASGVIVARRLGADGRAVVATLSFLVGLGVPLAGWGLGEAGVTLVRGRGHPLKAAMRTTITVVLGSSIVVAGLLAVVAQWLFGSDDQAVGGAIVAGCIALPAAAVAVSLAQLLEAQQRPILTSAAKALTASVTVVATAIFVLGFDLGAAGGVAAIAVGWVAAALLLIIATARDGLRPLPGLDRRFLEHGLRLGVPLQVGAVLVVASSRIDLLLVAALLGTREAGLYSVSLTGALMVSYASESLLIAAQPRIASLPLAGALDDVERFTRAAITMSIAAALVLAALLPFAIPLAFGYGFRPAIPAATVLLVAGILQAVHIALSRSLAALGRTKVVARSHGAALVTLLASDVILIPKFGLLGAASAAIAASLAGAVVSWANHSSTWRDAKLHGIAPRWSDLRTIADSVRSLRPVTRR